MNSRYALIRYRARSGIKCVGSGLLVRDCTVLTADHVADGSEYSVECDGGSFRVDSIVRSGTVEVDLAILFLSGSAPTPNVTPMRFARVDRSRPVKVTQCVAVGFPRWGMDNKGRASAQVEGYVRTADGLHMLPDGTDGEWLTLVGNRIPQVPNGSLAPESDSPWGGMSGAVVVCHDMVIGVIRSHNLAKGPESLTVTPLTALKRLPAGIRGQFCAALGLGEIDKLPMITGDAIIYSPPRLSRPLCPSEPAFSAEVRDRYRDAIAQAGLEVPDHWGETELAKLRCSYPGHDATADLLEALCVGLGALPVLEQIGGHQIGIRKLAHLYRRHVGRWPDSASREGMLILAASAGILERRRAASDANYDPEPLTALARFMLGIAGHRKAAGHLSAAGTATLDDAGLSGLADWLIDSLGQQRDDAADYLDAMVGGRTWALIELSAADSAEEAWPDAIVVETVSEQGAGQPHREPCTARSKESVLTALREVVNNHLPEGDVFIDLFMPRHLLDAEVEHWDVVQVGGRYESMSRHYQPRLRWAMHRHDGKLRARLQQRLGSVDWLADPEAIPAAITGNPACFADWLESREQQGTRHPPYFTGSSANEGDHDPLGALLWEGYGFAVWFRPQTAESVMRDAVTAATGLSMLERRNDLPQRLAMRLKTHRPVIIWSDPEGRAGFMLPNPRGGGTRRGGVR